jgi:UDPglucose--hexose-1-phosphate uridylyltransferase
MSACWGKDDSEQNLLSLALPTVSLVRCPTCAELERLLERGECLVEETGSFLAVVPFAAQRPFEQWLVPKRHHASFADTIADELDDLAPLLRRALQRLRIVHKDPP